MTGKEIEEKNGLYLPRLLKEGSGRKLDTDRYAYYRRIVVGLCLFFAQPTGTESNRIYNSQ